MNIDTRKFESSQKSRAQSVNSSKAYRKPSAFICCKFIIISLYTPQSKQSGQDNDKNRDFLKLACSKLDS